MNRPHEFGASLKASHGASDLPVWEEMYRQAFGSSFAAMVDHRQDGDHQRAGVDRSVILQHSKQILIDEKARFKPYNDILLEYVSNEQRKVPGWVCKPLMADYIAYAVLPLGQGYLLPVIQLQKAWLEHGDDWISTYGTIRAINSSWVTLNVAVPVRVLFPAIGAALRLTFTPIPTPEAA